jgi:soluble lytic murein transglycosylase-like protein
LVIKASEQLLHLEIWSLIMKGAFERKKGKPEKEEGLVMKEKSLSGVVPKEAFAKARRRGIVIFVLTNLVYITAIAGLSMVITEEKKTISSFPRAESILDEYRTKDKLYGILRTKGYSLGQGLDIAEAIVKRSKDLRLPLALIMAVIDQESEFYPNARSDKGAQGLMQIMPFKWDEYVAKLNLEVDRRAMTDPFMNITVGCQILKDFYDGYKHIKDDKVKIAKALTDYNNGEKSSNPNLKYAVEVSQKQDDYEKKLYRQN